MALSIKESAPLTDRAVGAVPCIEECKIARNKELYPHNTYSYKYIADWMTGKSPIDVIRDAKLRPQSMNHIRGRGRRTLISGLKTFQS